MITPTRVAKAVTTLSHGLGRKGAICLMISGIREGSQAVTLLVATWEHAFQQISNANAVKHSLVINTVLLRNLME